MNDDLMMLIILGMTMMFFLLSGSPVSEAVKKRLKKGEPICGCGHHFAFHTAEGVCKEQIPVPNGAIGGAMRYTVHLCTCQQYVGPYPEVSPKVMRELMDPPSSVEPYSQDK